MRVSSVALLLLVAAAFFAHGDYFTEAVALDMQKQPLPVERLAVASVSLISGEENEVCRLYRERLTTDLRQHTRYVIVEREDLDALLVEIELSQSDLSSDDQQLEVGRMLGAQALVSLSIAELAEGTEVFARVTEVETAQILYAQSFRDFAGDPDGDGDYDPQGELAPEDYLPGAGAPDAPAGGTAGAGPTPPPFVLHPDAAARDLKLSASYRERLRQDQSLSVNNRLYGLKAQNPPLYEALTRARRGLRIIAQDREMFLLFVFHSPRLRDQLRDRHPVLARRLNQRVQRIRVENPRKDVFVRGYIRRYGRLVLRDRLLADLVRQRFDGFLREP